MAGEGTVKREETKEEKRIRSDGFDDGVLYANCIRKLEEGIVCARLYSDTAGVLDAEFQSSMIRKHFSNARLHHGKAKEIAAKYPGKADYTKRVDELFAEFGKYHKQMCENLVAVVGVEDK
jgi:hypothetical protein